MAGYDFFTQPQGPAISPSLFPDAASAGIRAGNALPTTTTAIIQGAIEGIKTGQQINANYQAEQINQHTIDQFPVQDAIQAENLKQEQFETQIRGIQAETAAIDTSTQREIILQKNKNELEAAKQTATDFKAKQTISTALGSGDQQAQANLLNDQNMFGYILSHPELADSVAGVLSKNPYVDKAKLDNLIGTIGNYKQQQLQLEKDKAQAEATKAAFGAVGTAYNKVIGDAALDPRIKEMNLDELNSRVKVYRKGVKQLLPGTNKINEKVADLDPGLNSTEDYDVFIDNEKSPYGIKQGSADLITGFQGLHNASFGRASGKKAPPVTTPQAGGTATPSAAPATPSRDASYNLPEDQRQQVLDIAKKKGLEANLLDRVIDDILPPALKDNLVTKSAAPKLIPEDEGEQASADIAVKINNAADTLAQDTLGKLNSGSQEEKEALRDWAKANGVQLTESSLNSYYKNKIRANLAIDFDEAYERGKAEKLGIQIGENVKDKAEADRIGSLKGKTPDEALQTVNKANEVAKAAGLNPQQTKELETQAFKASYNPLLEGKPAYVKAVASVESNHNPAAVSPTGVKGLMQVTQRTASQYNLNRNIPEENVLAGQLYLEDLIREFGGNKALAYAAYNGGPGVIKEAQRLAGGSDNWYEVRPFVHTALRKFKKSFENDLADYLAKNKMTIDEYLDNKYLEIYKYPDKVMLNEKLYTNV